MIVEFFAGKVFLSSFEQLEVTDFYTFDFVGIVLYFNVGSQKSMTLFIVFQLGTSVKNQRVPS